MGNLANKFLEAMNIISDAKTKNASFDCSVQVTIRRTYQENATKYDVEYEGAMKTAVGATGYKVNDVVWAVIPKNDLTQTLQIIGLASSLAADKQVLRGEDDKFEKATPNLAILKDIQNLNEGTQSITLWNSDQIPPIYLDLDASKIINAINDSLYFEIGAEITSEIMNTKAIFGINCYFNDNQVLTLDINDVSGNPYFLQGEKQKKIFEVKENQIKSIQRIEIFASNLGAKDTISFSNFSFYGCRDIDFMDGLVANLLVKEGDVFREIGGLSNNKCSLTTSSSDPMIFKANLRHDGVLVQDKDLLKYTYNWYFKTLKDGLPVKIIIGDNPNTDNVESLYFDKDETDKRETDGWFDIVANAPNQLSVAKAALFMPSSWIYCEVIDEKGNKVKTVEGWIDNADKSYQLTLDASTPAPDPEDDGKYKFTLSVKNEIDKEAELPNDLKYVWYFSENGQEKTQLSYETSSIERDTTDGVYYVEVYTDRKFLVLANDSSIGSIPNAPSQDDLSLVITGKFVYLCKQDGSLQEQTIEPLKVWIYSKGKLQTEIADNYSIKWTLPTSNSMLKAIQGKDNADSIFSFGTQQYLLNSYNNNTISVTVADTKNPDILPQTASVEITFLKNGQPGTNGTDIICYFEKDGQALNYYDGDINDITISNFVVRRASQGTNIPVTVSIEPFSTILGPMYLKATCVSEDKGSVWYAYLPIISSSSPENFTLVEPTGSPYVLFSSSGKVAENLPLLFTTNKEIINAELPPINSYFQIDGSGTSRNISLSENFKTFKGDKDFELLTLYDSAENFIRIPILLLTNRFEYASINDWDGTGINLDENNNTILSPMAGFGKKEADGSFTGAIMGSLTPVNEEGKEEQGLFGYSKGARTFALDSNGNAWFKGHLQAATGTFTGELVAATGTFNGALNVGGGENGFSWRFSSTEGIKMWSGPQVSGKEVFKIWNNNGTHELYMRGNGQFTGKIFAEEGGSIAGWAIGSTSITKGTLGSNGFHMYTGNYGTGEFFGASNSQSWALGVGANFGVTNGGTLYANNAILKGLVVNNTNFSVTSEGIITAKSGKIAGFTFSDVGAEGFYTDDIAIRYDNLEFPKYNVSIGTSNVFNGSTDSSAVWINGNLKVGKSLEIVNGGYLYMNGSFRVNSPWSWTKLTDSSGTNSTNIETSGLTGKYDIDSTDTLYIVNGLIVGIRAS